MKKLTLSIHDKKKIDWAKAFAQRHETSVSQLFESYLDALMAFEKKKVILNNTLKGLRQPSVRPTPKEIERHLAKRRHRTSTKK